MKQLIELRVNGARHELAVWPWRTLNQVLREDLQLTGTKCGCGEGDCGACTVLVDGRAVASCLTLAVEAAGRAITTVEGLAVAREALHPVQEAFIATGAIQCGFCTPGMELAAVALLSRNPAPAEDEIRAALAGNLCRCTGYVKIVAAVQDAARRLRDRPAR
ncbi:MAG TPA: (2Fe-2S)-binding protein [Polyangia bacterium]|jgi:carbon-monoxide dehydrogenase small subunit